MCVALVLAGFWPTPIAAAAGPGEEASPDAAKVSKQQPGAMCNTEGGERHSVVQVIDGQTLRLVGGREVRLVGALAPSPFDAAAKAGAWPLADAAKRALERLAHGRSIRIVTAGRRTDRYGRLLAHAFVGSGESAVWIQGEILKAGYARAYGLDGSTSCFAQLLACEAVARKARAGLWAEAAYRVRSAAEVRGLLGMVGTFQLVEGKVAAVASFRSAIYVNFGGHWRTDFTISIRGAARREATRQWQDLAALDGRRLRVRGWIEQRGGPLIDIQDLLEIEWLDRGPSTEGEGAGGEKEQRAGR